MYAMTARRLLCLGASLALSILTATAANASAATATASTSCSTALFFGSGTCYLKALDTNAFGSSHMPPSSGVVSVPRQASADRQAVDQFVAFCRSTYVPPGGSLSAMGQKGGWYYTPCARELGVPTAVVGPLSFIPDAAVAASRPARLLALEAQRELVLPAPVMYASPGPGAGVPKVVNLPTWAWIASGEWRPVSASASAGPVTVTATATPRYVRWSWGDGTGSTCAGPGEVFTPGLSNPAGASPDCGHTYAVTSASGPGEEFPVTATMHWSVAWSATTGQGGWFPDMTTSAGQSWVVEQIENPFVPVTG